MRTTLLKNRTPTTFTTVVVGQFRQNRRSEKLLFVAEAEADGYYVGYWANSPRVRERFHRNWLEFATRPVFWQTGLRLFSTHLPDKKVTLALLFNKEQLWCTTTGMAPANYADYWREVSENGELRGKERGCSL